MGKEKTGRKGWGRRNAHLSHRGKRTWERREIRGEKASFILRLSPKRISWGCQEGKEENHALKDTLGPLDTKHEPNTDRPVAMLTIAEGVKQRGNGNKRKRVKEKGERSSEIVRGRLVSCKVYGNKKN